MSHSLSVDGSRNIHTTSGMHELIRLDKQSYFPAALQQVAVTLLKFKMVLLAKFYSTNMKMSGTCNNNKKQLVAQG